MALLLGIQRRRLLYAAFAFGAVAFHSTGNTIQTAVIFMSQVSGERTLFSCPLREELLVLKLSTHITFQLVAFYWASDTIQTAVIFISQVAEEHILLLCPLREELLVLKLLTQITF